MLFDLLDTDSGYQISINALNLTSITWVKTGQHGKAFDKHMESQVREVSFLTMFNIYSEMRLMGLV